MIPKNLNLPLQFALFITMALSHYCFALSGDKKQPIHITSKLFQYDGKTGKTTYSGDVHLTQGSIKLNADSVVMRSTPTGELISITATGAPANFEQKPSPDKAKVFGNAHTIVYTSASNSVTLTGDAHIRQGKQMTMNSDFIEYLADTEQVKANTTENAKTKGSRVNIVIPPRKNNQPGSIE